MKVLHVNTHINIGGISQYILSLAKALASKGVECMVATSGGELEPELEKNGIRHVCLDIMTKSELSPKLPKAASSLKDFVEKEDIDIIHAHTRVSQVVSRLASRRTKVPYISTCHGYFKPRLSRRIFDSWGARVVAISDAVKTHLEQDFGVDEDRIKVIYTGIDIGRFLEDYAPDRISEAKRSLGLGDGPVIGTMGRLSPVKGQRYLIEAMAYVLLKNKDAQCLVIGSGKEEDLLKKTAKRSGVENSVRFAGANYKDIPLYLSCMDLFVLPSVEEGLGLALLEAMAAGKPCVASDIGGIRDIIKNGVNGLLVPVGNARALGDAIFRILNDKVLSGKMAVAGRWLVKERFSIDLTADQMIDLYREVISEKK